MDPILLIFELEKSRIERSFSNKAGFYEKIYSRVVGGIN